MPSVALSHVNVGGVSYVRNSIAGIAVGDTYQIPDPDMFTDTIWSGVPRTSILKAFSGVVRGDAYRSSGRINPYSHANFLETSAVALKQNIDGKQGTASLYEFKAKPFPILNKLIAEWQGRVVSIHEDYFVAEVNGLTGEGVEGVVEEAIIPSEDVQEQDASQFRVGAFFRLCINYQTLPNRRKVRTTTIIFRRLPAYSASELRAADERAKQLFENLCVE